MGAKYRTMQNLEVIKSDIANSLIYLKGSIPGSKNSIILLKQTAKDIKRKTMMEKADDKKKKAESVKGKKK